MSTRLTCLAVALPVALALPGPVHAGPPVERPAPAGALEFGLAGVMMGVGVGLAAFGSVELVRTREHQRQCEYGQGGNGIDSCVFDPPVLGYAAVGLSWGLSVPLIIGSGLLFARGARVRREARSGAQTSVTPWWNRTAGGVTFTLRF
jgi:hypothetical protein